MVVALGETNGDGEGMLLVEGMAGEASKAAPDGTGEALCCRSSSCLEPSS